ncbi:MAG: gephyrin-like molybdotransferase Glp, partial [Ignavibacteriaceae bacterium]
YEEANEIISKEFSNYKLEIEEVDLSDSTGRILAEDIYSDIDLPPFTNSAMDGFAIKFKPDTTKWKIIGEISAGNFKEYNINEGLTVSIMTGGKIPDGADTIIPIEDIIIEKDTIILKENATFRKGINIRIKGNDLLKNQIALSKNIVIKPRHIAVAASCGKSKLKVYKKLNIAVLATGDELVDITTLPGEDKIRSSNLYALLSAINEMNQTGINLGIVKDQEDEIRARITSFLNSDNNILITTGGVSVGKYDYVKSIMEELGININFWKANIKPGKPIIFGTYNNGSGIKFVFGLPGNPVSCIVNFLIFIKNNILHLLGVEKDDLFIAELTEDLKKKDGKKHFMRGMFSKNIEGNILVKRVGLQSSGNLAEMGKANCLIIFDEEKRELKTGEKVFCIPI